MRTATEAASAGLPGRRLVVVISAALALDAALYSALTPLLPTIQRETGASDAAAGVLVATYALGLLAASLPGGWFTARVGARTAMVIGMLLFGAASGGFAVADSIVALDATRALQGVGAALTWTGGLAWLLAAGPEDRQGLLIGTAISASVVGSLIGPALGALAAHVGRGGVFAGIALLAIVMAIVVRGMPAPRRSGDLRLMSALRALVSPAGAIAFWVVLLAGALFGAMAVLAPLRLDDLGVGPTVIGAIFLAIGLSEMVIGPVAGRLSDQFGARLPMMYSLALTSVLLVALALVTSLGLTIVALVLLLPTVTVMIAPAFSALSTAARQRGVAMAGVLGAGNLAWASGEGAGAVSAGWLDGDGRAEVSYVAMAGLALITVVVLRSVRRPTLEPAD